MAFARVCMSFTLACVVATVIRAKPLNEQLILDDGKNLNIIELAGTPIETNENTMLSNMPQNPNKSPVETGIFPDINLAFKKFISSGDMAGNPSPVDVGRSSPMYQPVYGEVVADDKAVWKGDGNQPEDESVGNSLLLQNQLMKEFVTKNDRQMGADNVIDPLDLIKVSEPIVTSVQNKKSECSCNKNNDEHNDRVDDVKEDVKENGASNVFISADLTIVDNDDQKSQSTNQLQNSERINEQLQMKLRANRKEFMEMIETRLMEMEAQTIELLMSLL